MNLFDRLKLGRRVAWVVSRLHFKIALFVVATILVIFGLFSVHQLYTYRQKLIAREVEASEELCLTLTSSLEIAMLNADREAIQYSFTEIAQNARIVQVFLLNLEGTVKASSEPGLIGRTLRTDVAGCRDCHDSGRPNTLAAMVSLDSVQLLRVIAPVKNKAVCHSCHGTKPSVNGLLVLDRSLEPVRAEIATHMIWLISVAAAAVLAMMMVFRWYIRRQVINRVIYLESLARRVVAHELDVDIELDGSDELTSLAQSFNNMKETLKLSIQRIDNHRTYLAHLLENLIDGILILDERERVAWVNRTFSAVLELDPDQVSPGKGLRFPNGSARRGEIMAELIGRAKENRVTVKEIVRVPFSADRWKYLEIHVGELILPPQSKQEVIVIARDITERIMFEQRVSETEKLVTVGRLAAGIAHEINNPMASILTCAEGLIKSERGADDGKREYLDIIRNSARRCKMITQKLLDYSAATRPRMDIVPVEQVVRESAALLQFEATRKGVDLQIHCPPALPPVRGNHDSLIQVIINLMLNSLEAVSEGGCIEVRVGATTDRLMITVTDNGCGIGPADRARVFEPFFTTKPAGTGTGLGLSVSQGIIKQHSGQLEILESIPNRTTLRITLPLAGAGQVEVV